MQDTFSATAAQVASDATKPKKAPLTEAQKDVLRRQLEVARAKRSELAKAGLLKPRASKAKAKPAEALTHSPLSTFTKWTDDEWRACTLAVALQRLGDLTSDRERGAVLVSQRQNEEHLANVYHCIVCRKAVQDGRWIWKNDRRDPLTGLFTSDVLCSQDCHERFSNRVGYYMARAKGAS